MGRGQAALGRNGGPPTSTTRPPVSKTVAISPTKSTSSQCSASPVGGLSSNWRERDSGPSQSLLPAQEPVDSQGEELEKLLRECKTTLGITASQEGATNTAGKMYTVYFIYSLKSIDCRISV